MKVSLYTKKKDIDTEINRIIDNNIKLFCIRNKTKPVPLNIKERAQIQNNTFLVVKHPQPKICPQRKCLFYYQVKGEAGRCFHCIPEKQINSLLALKYPEEIFEIQRRKYPRIKTYNDSLVSFSLAGKQRVYGGKIIDVCMEGAKITGDFPVKIGPGNVVSPLSMTLFLRSSQSRESVVHIPEARVVRSLFRGEQTKEFSIHFVLPENLKEPLARYVDMRRLEDEERNS
jgi:hypothetical protein